MKSGRKSPSKLTAAQKELLRQEEEVRRREQELQRRLQKLPAELKQKREQERQIRRVAVTTVARGEYVARVQHQRERGKPGAPRRALRWERRAGKMRFLVLFMILTILLILLWRVMPA